MAKQVSDVLAYARKLAKTDSNGISDADGIDFLNESQQEMHMGALEKRADLFFQESYRDITLNEITGGTSPGKFLYPNDQFLQKNLQINLIDPTNAGSFITPTPVDMSNLPTGTTWEWLKLNQPTNAVLIDDHGDWFEIAPTPTVIQTNAIKIGYFLGPVDYALTTDFIGYPYNLNYRILSRKVAAKYYESFQDSVSAGIHNSVAQAMLDLLLNVLTPGEQQQPRAQEVNVGNNGWRF